MTLHEDELAIDDELVRRLVDTQMPQYAAYPLTAVRTTGSSNALFRLGDELAVRIPRQPGGSATVLKEARWLPLVQPSLPVPTPYVVAVGEPDEGYPEHWSVVQWLPGHNPVVGEPHDQLAPHLARVVTALRRLEVPGDARSDPTLRWYRAEPLPGIDDDVRSALEACRSLPGLDLDLVSAAAVWDGTVAVATSQESETEAHWLHGDLLAENVLVRDGHLAAVLDFGGLAVGDPSVDLAVAWELLDSPGRTVFREAVGVDDRTWLSGRGWALAIALLTFPYYWDTMPERCASRLVMARRVLADASR